MPFIQGLTGGAAIEGSGLDNRAASAAEGSRPADQSPLPYGRHWLDEQDIAAVVNVLRGERLTQGSLIAAFEAALADCCGARYAVAVSSGTSALHIATLAAGVGPGDLGITSPISFVASANCVAYCGGTPAFADVDPATVTLDPVCLEVICRQRAPKVLIPVDFAGQPADLPAIHRVAKHYGSLVIEDAAHALGAAYGHAGQQFRAGDCTHADMAVLSFHPVKHITTGEGGAVLTNQASLYERLLDLRSHGITKDSSRLRDDHDPWAYEQQGLGFNYRLTDIQCALGLSQLRKLGAFVERRRAIVQAYGDALRDLTGKVDLLIETPPRRSAYHLLVARLAGGPDQRRRVFEHLLRRGIQTQVHYPPVHLQPWYRERYGFRTGDFPNAEAYAASCLSLPLFPAMSDGDVGRVVRALRDVL